MMEADRISDSSNSPKLSGFPDSSNSLDSSNSPNSSDFSNSPGSLNSPDPSNPSDYAGISFEEFGQLLDEVAEELPEEIFVNLNGGINLIEDILYHPEGGERGNLFIMGQYHHGGNLGRYITIYYGSFMKLHGRGSRKFLKRELARVVKHEFLHHLESMAGEKGLEIQDAIDMARYKNRMRDRWA